MWLNESLLLLKESFGRKKFTSLFQKDHQVCSRHHPDSGVTVAAEMIVTCAEYELVVDHFLHQFQNDNFGGKSDNFVAADLAPPVGFYMDHYCRKIAESRLKLFAGMIRQL